MTRRFTLAIILAALLILAGCASKQQQHSIGFDGEVNYTDDTFTIDGEIYVNSGSAGPQSYPNVKVVLYAANKSRLDAIPIGPMSAYNESGDAPVRRTIKIKRSYRPTYVVIESPGFWRDDRAVPVDAFEWEPNMSAYDRYGVSNPDEKFSED
jgi:hypothetical protein